MAGLDMYSGLICLVAEIPFLYFINTPMLFMVSGCCWLYFLLLAVTL